MSRIGKKPIAGSEWRHRHRSRSGMLTVKGPKGTLDHAACSTT